MDGLGDLVLSLLVPKMLPTFLAKLAVMDFVAVPPTLRGRSVKRLPALMSCAYSVVSRLSTVRQFAGKYTCSVAQ